MRIISDFHDYYDVGMKNGIDPQLPYRRFRREEPICFPNTGWQSLGRKISFYAMYYRIIFIGFAGKIRPCIDISFNTIAPSFCFEPDLIDNSFFIKVNKNRWYYGTQAKREKDIQSAIEGMKNEVIECFEYKHKPEFHDLFEKYKTAIFVFLLY